MVFDIVRLWIFILNFVHNNLDLNGVTIYYKGGENRIEDVLGIK